MVSLLVGILLAFCLWKLLKVSFTFIVWLVLIGIVVAFIVPGGFAFVGTIGVAFIGMIATLLILCLLAMLFFSGG